VLRAWKQYFFFVKLNKSTKKKLFNNLFTAFFVFSVWKLFLVHLVLNASLKNSLDDGSEILEKKNKWISFTGLVGFFKGDETVEKPFYYMLFCSQCLDKNIVDF
jgi:hypothetical protein